MLLWEAGELQVLRGAFICKASPWLGRGCECMIKITSLILEMLEGIL